MAESWTPQQAATWAAQKAVALAAEWAALWAVEMAGDLAVQWTGEAVEELVFPHLDPVELENYGRRGHEWVVERMERWRNYAFDKAVERYEQKAEEIVGDLIEQAEEAATLAAEG
jgi:hypothetical protein